MNEAADAGETVTGVVGMGKRLVGGIARQAFGQGAISPASENLQRKLLTLQGQVGPILLNEKRLSETERERLRKIVGEVDAWTDETSLRESLKDLIRFLKQHGAK